MIYVEITMQLHDYLERMYHSPHKQQVIGDQIEFLEGGSSILWTPRN
jgi:hypothetical protein